MCQIYIMGENNIHQCLICGKYFSRKDKLATHKKWVKCEIMDQSEETNQLLKIRIEQLEKYQKDDMEKYKEELSKKYEKDGKYVNLVEQCRRQKKEVKKHINNRNESQYTANHYSEKSEKYLEKYENIKQKLKNKKLKFNEENEKLQLENKRLEKENNVLTKKNNKLITENNNLITHLSCKTDYKVAKISLKEIQNE